ncbi:TPA: hypothetical protein JD322_001349 [Citrobacter freundii]|uniref:hypothetical protein n=1 Tax=Citrobacter europaeus TaxID=1914243 RepID=UPI001A214D26|nr:hypothetical protein [Citrobacter freundii]
MSAFLASSNVIGSFKIFISKLTKYYRCNSFGKNNVSLIKNGDLGAQMGNLNNLAELVCGGADVDAEDNDCEISEILKHLKAVLKNVLSEINDLSSESDSRITLYGPFLVRTLLEIGVTALIGRLDPTRLLIVKRTQQHGDYSTEKAWSSAIRWQGDVVDSKVANPWPADKSYKDITKALLGDYYFDLYWQKALKKVCDSNVQGGTWLAEIKGLDINAFSGMRRSSVSRLYSQSSKGVHSEFVIPPGSLYDKLTIKRLASEIIQLLSELGLLINHLPHVAYRIETDKAVQLFNGIEQVEVMP